MFKELLKRTISKEDIAKLLKTNPKALEEFERSYAANALNQTSDNFFEINSRQASENNRVIENEEIACDCSINMEDLINRIVDEFLAETKVYRYMNGKAIKENTLALPCDNLVTLEEINALPKVMRPQLTSTLQKRDIGEIPSYITLIDMYKRMLETKNPTKRKGFYNHFRQGLDILDLDGVTYEMLGMNPNAMGYWLPKMVAAIDEQGFFKIPNTTIVKVPMNMLQLTRCDYMELTKTTLTIVDKFCQKAFDLDETKEYFIKTGTYSSKFDFRNAYVHSKKEVRELGEYLLYIHFQANQMASPLSSPCIYGVSTTNEWVVRDFIKDKENNPCIYKGLPLHTEYRVFVDFDTNKVIGINPYWDAKVMKQRFGHEDDKDSPHQIHDYIIYCSHEDKLMERYNQNKDKIIRMVEAFLPNVELSGQWSIDIMQNDDEFWFIDMALAENSAFYDCVPLELRNPTEENWLPDLSTV